MILYYNNSILRATRLVGILFWIYFRVVVVVVVGLIVVVVDLGFTSFLTSQVISVAFYSEREKSDKFCSEALSSVTRDPQLYFPSEGSHTKDFYALYKSIDPGQDRTCEPWIQSTGVARI